MPRDSDQRGNKRSMCDSWTTSWALVLFFEDMTKQTKNTVCHCDRKAKLNETTKLSCSSFLTVQILEESAFYYFSINSLRGTSAGSRDDQLDSNSYNIDRSLLAETCFESITMKLSTSNVNRERGHYNLIISLTGALIKSHDNHKRNLKHDKHRNSCIITKDSIS